MGSAQLGRTQVEVEFQSSWLRLLALLYLLLPIEIFLLGWLQLWVGIPLACAVGYGAWRMLGEWRSATPGLSLSVSRTWLIIFGVVCFAWVVASGIGGYGFQNSDFHARNAIFRDLIERPWPVVYDRILGEAGQVRAMLVYYHSYWMPSAVVGKLLGWGWAQVALFWWSVLGAWLALLLLARRLNRHAWLALLFIFFSGLDSVGWYWIFNRVPGLTEHIEWWSQRYQYSSFTTTLFWVFNQTVPAWIATLLLLETRGVRTAWALLGLCLAFAPLPFVGLIAVLLGAVAPQLKREGQDWRASFKRVFLDSLSPSNVLVGLPILAVFASYFTMNESGGHKALYITNAPEFYRYLLFWFLEVGVFCSLTARRHYREPLWIVSVLSLLVIPWFQVGSFADFCMRASIPALVVLFTYWVQSLETAFLSRRWITVALLIAPFLVGAYTPIEEIVRSVEKIACHFSQERCGLIADGYGSLEGHRLVEFPVFYGIRFEQSTFYRVFSKIAP